MSSSVSNRSNPRHRTRQPNSKSESKTELEKSKTTSVKGTVERNRRSLSVSKNDQARESQQKSHSVDRKLSRKYGSQDIPIKSTLVDSKKTSVGNKKSMPSSTNSKNLNLNRKTDSTKYSSTKQTTKTTDKSSRSPMKSLSKKTNVEIAKSFVRNASNSKSKKVVKSSNTKKISEKIKSEKLPKEMAEEIERPKTSIIRKDPSDANTLSSEQSNNAMANFQNSGDSIQKSSKSKSPAITDDDDDKVSYEEDFEDYDSDFEESDSESVSYTSSSGNISDHSEHVLDYSIDRNSTSRNLHTSATAENVSNVPQTEPLEIKKNKEKNFLRMSDRSFLSNDKTNDQAVERKLMKSSHSFINFASAVEQEEKKKYSNKVLKRASDLLEMVTLSDVSSCILDIPPMKYDTFMRFYGKNDYKQVFIQTDNVEEEEVQTDEIVVTNKWTQNPPNDNLDFGGDTIKNNVDEIDSLKTLFNAQNVKLSSFIQNCSKVFLTLLDEEFPISSHIQATQRRNELFYSDGYYILPPPSFLKDIPVLNVYCSSKFSHYVLTIHDGVIKFPVTDDERGVICVWNVLDKQKPEHILIAHSQPTCATFGPVGNDVIIAGMVDGTVVLWDLSDHSQTGVDESFSLKSVTYSTAVILGKDNHHSHIVAIQALTSSLNADTITSFSKSNNSRNFHVLTLEDLGVINIWVAVEVLKPDFSGFDTDLGLAPGGKLRLVRSSTLLLHDITALPEIQKLNIRTFDFTLIPFDSNRILITTDAGIVLHVNRQGGSADPRFYSNDLDFSSEVRCIVCSPHNEDLFLVGCSDGSARLYHLKLVRPVKVFFLAAKGDPVSLIQWSPIHPAMFAVLSSSSNLHLWNLLEDSLHPVNSYHFADSRITWFAFNVYQDISSQKSHQTILHMFISREDGQIEVHIFKHDMNKTDYSRDLEFMKNL